MADKSKMACNKPMKSDRAGKKKMVKACANGQEKLIHFGATGYGHNYSAAARKSFRARHKCSQAKSCLLYTSPSPRDLSTSRMPSSA